MRKHGFDFRFIHKDKDGKILDDSGFLPNHMTDAGFELMYGVFFRGATAPTGFEIGLSTLGLTQTSTTVTEVTGTGYARQAVARDAIDFPTLALDAGDMQVITKTVQFENTDASVAWDGAVAGFLHSVGAGAAKLICYRPLSATRTLQPGDTLDVTIRIKGLQPA